ncbi:MAG: argininosuccinate lyase [Clostridia bacterium]|nr:argininosuccinate lyase [Clostridia bacterium]
MAKMWAGRTDGITDKAADDFNSSISFDSRMYRQDIEGSIAHARMLAKCGIISEQDCALISEGLAGILADVESGALPVDLSCEDIHMFVEQVLTERIGDAGKRLHTARSRNDQVALDLRLYLRASSDEIAAALRELIGVCADLASKYKDCIMPGYTHLQRAQPVTFGHHLTAYCMMLLRDLDRVRDARKRINISPIGSCALAGTTYETDRYFEASELGFPEISVNSIDGVSDRDFAIELCGVIAIIMMHLSRLSEELIMWSSFEFRFVTLPDSFTTGSSIMPQKKNPDMAELARGKTARTYGNLLTLLTMMKGLPLAYNKDMQEDKEPVFDSVDTVLACLNIFIGMLPGMKVHRDNMRRAAGEGFINATDLADYLVSKGLPFRDAYKLSGRAVARAVETGDTLETLPLSEYKALSGVFDEDLYRAVDLDACVARKKSTGAASPASVEEQLKWLSEELRKYDQGIH